MSRYHNNTGQHGFTYGFDACGIPGYFLTTNQQFDTRRFMADVGCHVSQTRMLVMLTELNRNGASIPKEHIIAMALGLPF